MLINMTRQQVLQAYATARQRTYRHILPLMLLLLVLAILQFPSVAIILSPRPHPANTYEGFASTIHHIFQPFNWQPLHDWYPLQIVIYYIGVCLLLEIIYIPLAFHIEYTLARRFKLGTHPPRVALLNIVRKQGSLIARWAALIELFYLFLALQPLLWWIDMALVMALISFVSQARSSSKLRRLFTISALPESATALQLQLQALLTHCSLTAQEIMVISKPGQKMAANAHIMSFGKKRFIGLTDTMVQEFTPDEIEVLIAHEIGHHVHHDLWRKIAVWTGIRLIGYGIMALIMVGGTVTSLSLTHNSADITTIPFFVLAQILFWLSGSPYFYTFNRYIEHKADEYALQTTGKAIAFKQAMIRIANINRIVANPQKNTATHPSIVSRIKYAEEFAKLH